MLGASVYGCNLKNVTVHPKGPSNRLGLNSVCKTSIFHERPFRLANGTAIWMRDASIARNRDRIWTENTHSRQLFTGFLLCPVIKFLVLLVSIKLDVLTSGNPSEKSGNLWFAAGDGFQPIRNRFLMNPHTKHFAVFTAHRWEIFIYESDSIQFNKCQTACLITEPDNLDFKCRNFESLHGFSYISGS